MNLLYSFLTSNEFKLQVEGIVEGITEMQEDLIREKNTHKKLWKQREKQFEKVVSQMKKIEKKKIDLKKKLLGPIKSESFKRLN